MTRYKCVKPLVIDNYGEDGDLKNEHMVIDIDSIWEVNQEPHRFVGGADSIRLESDGNWIEIYDDTLKGHFLEIE